MKKSKRSVCERKNFITDERVFVFVLGLENNYESVKSILRNHTIRVGVRLLDRSVNRLQVDLSDLMIPINKSIRFEANLRQRRQEVDLDHCMRPHAPQTFAYAHAVVLGAVDPSIVDLVAKKAIVF